MKLVNMAQKSDKQEVLPAEPSTPKFPYGLCIQLDESAIKKLGWKDLPKVGMKCSIEAKGFITLVRNMEGLEHSSKGVDIQITDLAVGVSSKTAAETLYPDKKE